MLGSRTKSREARISMRELDFGRKTLEHNIERCIRVEPLRLAKRYRRYHLRNFHSLLLLCCRESTLVVCWNGLGKGGGEEVNRMQQNVYVQCNQENEISDTDPRDILLGHGPSGRRHHLLFASLLY